MLPTIRNPREEAAARSCVRAKAPPTSSASGPPLREARRCCSDRRDRCPGQPPKRRAGPAPAAAPLERDPTNTAGKPRHQR
ncbi:MAG: hypothetical protein FJW27_10290 [Acidimicrobiia bacterium]|nr:hypothetical protein [Acidimicrobiia bacterium]